jgi:hypothetical protein
MRESLLAWQRQRYLKWSLAIVVLGIALYVSQGGNSAQPPNGGTWQGYILGTVGALLIVWLSMLGIRKRSYRSSLGTVQGWTSAHIYLGIALLLIATLHCAAQFGWNVHTFAYVLMCLVIVSGLYGLYVYLHFPGRMADNRAGKDQKQWIAELADVDDRIATVAESCDAVLQAMTMSALELTRVGGSSWQQLTAVDRSLILFTEGGKAVANVEQGIIIDTLSQRIPDARKAAEAEVLNELLALFGRRQVILHLLRRDIRMRALVKIWLYFHVPLTIALLVALSIHIFSVFIYW